MTRSERRRTIVAWRLVLAAYAGVRVVVCPKCNGLGEVGLASFRAPCPRCRGCGESTNGVNIDQRSLA